MWDVAPLLGQVLGAAIADKRHMPLLESLIRRADMAELRIEHAGAGVSPGRIGAVDRIALCRRDLVGECGRLEIDRVDVPPEQRQVDPAKAERELGWTAQLSVAQGCVDTWRWQSANPDGFPDSPELDKPETD